MQKMVVFFHLKIFGKKLKMSEESSLNIFYTNKALLDISDIKKYLLFHFTQREVDQLYVMLQGFEKVIKAFPELYPISLKGGGLRRAVLSKQLSLFYKVSTDKIMIIAAIDNRMSFEKWPR